jgi:hypothetical protein
MELKKLNEISKSMNMNYNSDIENKKEKTHRIHQTFAVSSVHKHNIVFLSKIHFPCII